MARKDLYLASCLDELNKLTKIPSTNSSSIRTIECEMSKLKCQANELWERDEELAYVLFMKYFNYYEILKKLTRNKCGAALKEDLLCSLDRTEKLKQNLKLRYMKLKQTSVTPTVIDNQVSKPTEKPDPVKPPSLSLQSFELATLIRKHHPVLVIDVRTKSDFEQCHIAFDQLINLPFDEALKRGTTVNTISTFLNNTPYKKLWEMRGKFDDIILIDDCGIGKNVENLDDFDKLLLKDNPLRIVKDAIFKWDAEHTLSKEPKILIGGMSEFRKLYPPLSLFKTHFMDQEDKKLLINKPNQINYPDLKFNELQSDHEDENLSDSIASKNNSDLSLDRSKIKFSKFDLDDQCSSKNSSMVERPLAPKPSELTNRLNQSKEITSNRFDEISNLSKTTISQSKFPQIDRKQKPSNLLRKTDQSIPSDDTCLSLTLELSKGKSNLSSEFNKLTRIDSASPNVHPNQPVYNTANSPVLDGTTNHMNLESNRSKIYSKISPHFDTDSDEDEKVNMNSTEFLTTPKAPSISATAPSIPSSETKPAINFIPRTGDLPQIITVIHDEIDSLRPDPGHSLSLNHSSLSSSSSAIYRTLTNGLRNLGNTCYMNSVIQCLLHTRALVHYFLDGLHERRTNKTNSLGYGGEIVKHFELLLSASYNEPNPDVQLLKFRAAVAKHQNKFASSDQQDSLEFLLFLLDGLHEDLNEARSDKKDSVQNTKQKELKDEYSSVREQAEAAWIQHKQLNNSIVVSSFQGLLRSTVKCDGCHKTSITFDVFMVLSLPLENNNLCYLHKCINLFLQKEEMVGSCQWFCPSCNTRKNASKWIELWKLPTYLIIHLKRFQYDSGGWKKQTTRVNYPIDSLDMSSFVVGPKKHSSEYALFAVVNHRGTMESGHYTAYCRNIRDGKWYEYDDELVSLLNHDRIQNDNAYILFYELMPRVGVFFEKKDNN